MSGQRYEVLHYPGDVTGSDSAQPGAILGCDEFGRPFEVIDAEYEPAPEALECWCPDAAPDEYQSRTPGCPRHAGRTTVQLQYATPENIRAWIGDES